MIIQLSHREASQEESEDEKSPVNPASSATCPQNPRTSSSTNFRHEDSYLELLPRKTGALREIYEYFITVEPKSSEAAVK